MEWFLKISGMLRKATLVSFVVSTVVAALAGTQGTSAASVPQSAITSLSTAAAAPTGRLTKLVAEAKHQTTLGISYLYAGGHGASPAPLNSHVDCSGLVRELYHYAFGTDIGSGSGDGMIRTSGKFTRTSHPVPGDVVLLGNNGSAPAYHSGIYIGTVNGEAAMVGSPTTGQNIKVQQSRGGSWGGDLMGYWHYNGATAADSGSLTAAAPPAPQRVRGSFDNTSARPGSFTVGGWVVDPQRKSVGAQAQVLLDGRQVAVLRTPLVRADVNRVMGSTGAHGFHARIAAGAGRHTVCVNARPAGSTSIATSLGCRVITVPTPTRGSFDTITARTGSFAVGGWAYDLRAATGMSTVRITADGRVVANIRTGIARTDVNRIFQLSGTHGFYVRVRATPGRHVVCAVSLPLSAASSATNLGCKTIAVP